MLFNVGGAGDVVAAATDGNVAMVAVNTSY